MVPLFVPEETWGPRSWGLNHWSMPVEIEHGLKEAGIGFWGFLPPASHKADTRFME